MSKFRPGRPKISGLANIARRRDLFARPRFDVFFFQVGFRRELDRDREGGRGRGLIWLKTRFPILSMRTINVLCRTMVPDAPANGELISLDFKETVKKKKKTSSHLYLYSSLPARVARRRIKERFSGSMTGLNANETTRLAGVKRMKTAISELRALHRGLASVDFHATISGRVRRSNRINLLICPGQKE